MARRIARGQRSDRSGNSAEETGERIQKALAAQGIGSRRQIESWIREGRITVNGKPADLGQKILLSDRIYLNGKLVRMRRIAHKLPRVILYHKSEGQLCSRVASERSESIFADLPKMSSSRWCMVGRLDVNTSGLILFTTSGELANKLAHPSSQIEREYAVRVFGELEPEQIKQMQAGIQDKGETLKFDNVVLKGGEGKNTWYHVTLQTGKNREVRRMFAAFDLTVARLIRVRFGNFILQPGHKKGKAIDLPDHEVKALMDGFGLE